VCSRLYALSLCKYTLAQRRNRLTTHFLERIPIAKRRTTSLFPAFLPWQVKHVTRNKKLPSISWRTDETLNSLKWWMFSVTRQTSFSNVSFPYRVTGEYGMNVLNENSLFSLMCVQPCGRVYIMTVLRLEWIPIPAQLRATPGVSNEIGVQVKQSGSNKQICNETQFWTASGLRIVVLWFMTPTCSGRFLLTL
jgi:hypothetical protein